MSSVTERKFLFLQGPVGPFFKQLGEGLEKLGISVLHINFDGGGEFFCKVNNAINFTHDQSYYPEFLEEIIRSHKITDIVIYGDCRDIHRIAIEKSKSHQIELHIFEEGYTRPYWVTLERSGLNANSCIPQDQEFYSKLEVKPQPKFLQFKYATWSLGIYCVIYYFAYISKSKTTFKKYKHHSKINYRKIALRWSLRFLALPFRKLSARMKKLTLKDKNFYLVPLQLDRDSQITEHSSFKNNLEFAQKIMNSFKENASPDSLLVFKNHPLDCGSRRIKQAINYYVRQVGLKDRVIFLDAGKLPRLLSFTKGVITINSTAGLSAIAHNKKTIVLGKAIYNFEGLTYQKGLDNFWNDNSYKIPQPGLYNKFRYYILKTRQLNGGFYTQKSRAILVESFLKKVAGKRLQRGNVIYANFKKPDNLKTIISSKLS